VTRIQASILHLLRRSFVLGRTVAPPGLTTCHPL